MKEGDSIALVLFSGKHFCDLQNIHTCSMLLKYQCFNHFAIYRYSLALAGLSNYNFIAVIRSSWLIPYNFAVTNFCWYSEESSRDRTHKFF